jgi:hypothetical protein
MTDSGVWVSSKLRVFEPLLRSWLRECKRYTEITGTDVCWWFNERASISTFAIAAARRRGWVALEEFSNKKGRIDAKGAKRVGHGRCDLYLANSKTDYAFEFKQAWQPLFALKDPLSVARRRWTEAWTDVGALNRDEAMYRMAGTFIVPFFRPVPGQRREGTVVTERLTRLIAELRELEDVQACAWLFPRAERLRRSETGSYFPGIALALRRRKRAA